MSPQLAIGLTTAVRSATSTKRRTPLKNTDLDGHSYYGDCTSVMSDMYYLIHEGMRAPNRFGMKDQEHDGKKYCVFLPRRN